MSEQCPQCHSPDAVVTVRSAYEGDPPVPELAPPPAPAVTTAATAEPRWNTTTKVWATVFGAGLAAVLLAVVGAALTGRSVGALLAGVPVPGIGLLVVLYLARTPDLPGPHPEVVSRNHVLWTRRRQVWEHARHCRSCRVAFWSPGVLGEGFPGTPGIPLHEFPLTVGALAERADGNTYAKHS